MFLQQIKLNNIRSYQDATISFPKSSTLLSGDIGCGKSSILLAIEFALFGTSRPDLPAEALLRKGTTQGAVELTFQINQQQIIIKRNLKKDKNSIKQLAGHIIINNVKKELMPIEMKAEIIKLLNYPEDLLTKNKNYIFRYTVYTPQEEMKFILQENKETRLDVLRKIFNIDKYKSIRDNLQISLKDMRKNIIILKTKIEPLEEWKTKNNEIEQEKKELVEKQNFVSPKLNSIKEQVQIQKEELTKLEQKQQEQIKIKNQQETNLALLKSKQNQIEQLNEKNGQLNKEINRKLLTNFKKENVAIEVKDLEIQISKILQNKASFEERATNLQRTIQNLNTEIKTFDPNKIKEKETEQIKLTNEIENKQELHQKQLNLDQLFQKTLEAITKNQTILEQAKENQTKIDSLDNCPTCLQIVPIEHKTKILNQETTKIEQAERLLNDFQTKKNEINQQKEMLTNQLSTIEQQEKSLILLKNEIEQLKEKEKNQEIKKEELQKSLQENNSLMKQLTQLPDQNVFKENLQKKQLLLQQISQQESLQQQINEAQEQIERTDAEIKHLILEKVELEQVMNQFEDVTPQIAELKNQLETLIEEEKNWSVKETEIRTKLQNASKQQEEIQQRIKLLQEDQNKLIQIKTLHHWLDQFFINLMHTIERRVMIRIHQLFNQLFKEWFTILIDDENMYARIDDSFSPVIEQNGYEINFVNLSGGERTSASLAYRLALNKVINDVIQQIQTKDLIILDEPTDGFSSEQLDKVRDVLDKLNLQQTIIVSHESKIESFVDNIVRISKVGHVSCVG
jgi:DNA repair protein SbcC/Rad50